MIFLKDHQSQSNNNDALKQKLTIFRVKNGDSMNVVSFLQFYL